MGGVCLFPFLILYLWVVGGKLEVEEEEAVLVGGLLGAFDHHRVEVLGNQ